MWSKRIGTTLAVLAGVGISYVGVQYLTDPLGTAPSFVGASGPRPDAADYLGNAKGIRDLFSGVLVIALLASKQYRAAGWTLSVVTMIPAADAISVLAHHGSPAMALGVHAATAVAVLVAGQLLLAAERHREPTADQPHSQTSLRQPEQVVRG